MTVEELSRNQLIALKRQWLLWNEPYCSFADLENCDEIVDDEIIFEKYKDKNFRERDFV